VTEAGFLLGRALVRQTVTRGIERCGVRCMLDVVMRGSGSWFSTGGA